MARMLLGQMVLMGLAQSAPVVPGGTLSPGGLLPALLSSTHPEPTAAGVLYPLVRTP